MLLNSILLWLLRSLWHHFSDSLRTSFYFILFLFLFIYLISALGQLPPHPPHAYTRTRALLPHRHLDFFEFFFRIFFLFIFFLFFFYFFYLFDFSSWAIPSSSPTCVHAQTRTPSTQTLRFFWIFFSSFFFLNFFFFYFLICLISALGQPPPHPPHAYTRIRAHLAHRHLDFFDFFFRIFFFKFFFRVFFLNFLFFFYFFIYLIAALGQPPPHPPHAYTRRRAHLSHRH